MKQDISLNDSKVIGKNTAAFARKVVLTVIGSMVVISSGLLDIFF